MTWLGPDETADPGGRRGRWIYLALAYALLVGSTVAAAAIGTLEPSAIALAGVAAVWLAPLAWLYPRKGDHRVAVAAHFAGILVLGGLLVRENEVFVAFASVGYPLAIALFPATAMMIAVAAAAIIMVLAQTGPPDATLGPVVLGIAVPLLLAGWRVAAESEQRRRTGERLRAVLAENAELQARLLAQARKAGRLDERRRLAREIHDTLAQDLVALITQLRAADGTADDAERRRRLGLAADLAAHALAEARRSVRALRPGPLTGSRLPEALASLAARWRETGGVTCAFEVTGTPRRLVAAVETTLFRVAQEALSNVARHARASRVGITLSYLDDTVLLDVRDDGVGFDPDAVGTEGGFGLGTMRQRVRGVGGTLSVESAPGEGTAVAAAVPLLPADADDRGDPDGEDDPEGEDDAAGLDDAGGPGRSARVVPGAPGATEEEA